MLFSFSKIIIFCFVQLGVVVLRWGFKLYQQGYKEHLWQTKQSRTKFVKNMKNLDFKKFGWRLNLKNLDWRLNLKNLGWRVAFLAIGVCLGLGYRLYDTNKKVSEYVELTKAQKALLDAYKERIHIADTTIIKVNGKIAEHLRNGSLDEKEAADYLERIAADWQCTPSD